MFVNADMRAIFHTELLDMFMMYLHTKYMPSFYGQLVIAVKPKTKYTFRANTMLFVLQRGENESV
jgi:hypothetical protein